MWVNLADHLDDLFQSLCRLARQLAEVAVVAALLDGEKAFVPCSNLDKRAGRELDVDGFHFPASCFSFADSYARASQPCHV